MSSRQDRIREINAEIDKLQARLHTLFGERKQLSLAQSKEEYPCRCVALNGDIGVFDMGEQEQLGRKPLGLGFVCETLSASKFCPVCQGTGKPKE
jgi:hypothetical protein